MTTTTVSRQPAVEGWMLIDLAPFVTDGGEIAGAGYKHAWSVTASAPHNVPFRFSLGTARSIDRDKATQFLAAVPQKASRIEVVGSDPRGIQAMINVLRGGWETAWPTTRCVHCNSVQPDHDEGCPTTWLKRAAA